MFKHSPIQITTPHDREAGVALVEFALVVPLLLVILFGILDFGKAFNYWNDGTHLAATGARLAAVNKAESPSLQTYIQQLADTPELRAGGTSAVPNPTQVCVSFPAGTSNVGDPVQVKVTTTYHFLSIIGLDVGTKDLVSKSTMRIEQPPTNYTANPC